MSLLRNSFAAQEFGSDYTDPYDVRGAGAGLDFGTHGGLRWRLDGAAEWQDSLSVNAAPATGRYEATLPAARLRETRATLTVSHPTALSALGTELRAGAELRGAMFRQRGPDGAGVGEREALGRLFAYADVERPIGAQRLVLQTTAGGVAGPAVPAQELVYLGGPTSAPGYEYHGLVARLGVAQRVEWRTPVPFPAIPLGRFGRAPAAATLAPFAHAVYLDRPARALRPGTADQGGWFPSVGVAALAFFDLLRVDVARGLRDGRWSFSLDVTRDLWPVL